MLRINLRLSLPILILLLAALACGWSDPLTLQAIEEFIITPTPTPNPNFTSTPTPTATPEGTPPAENTDKLTPAEKLELTLIGASQQPDLVKTVVASLEETSSKEGLKAETVVYRVANKTDWDAIKTFYEGELGDGWKEDTKLEQGEDEKDESTNQDVEKKDVLKTHGWTYNGFSYKQAIVLAYLEHAKDEKKYLIVVLFSEK